MCLCAARKQQGLLCPALNLAWLFCRDLCKVSSVVKSLQTLKYLKQIFEILKSKNTWLRKELFFLRRGGKKLGNKLQECAEL